MLLGKGVGCNGSGMGQVQSGGFKAIRLEYLPWLSAMGGCAAGHGTGRFVCGAVRIWSMNTLCSWISLVEILCTVFQLGRGVS